MQRLPPATQPVLFSCAPDRASVALAAGRRQDALRLLEQARIDRDWWLCWIEVDPRWDPLREESRFKKLLPRREPATRSKFGFIYAMAACAAILIAGCLLWWIAKPRPLPFGNVKFTKVTTNGTAESAAISPDGNSVVYAARDVSGLTI
jgi:hypothetical protein